jgi:hypothetical protein
MSRLSRRHRLQGLFDRLRGPLSGIDKVTFSRSQEIIRIITKAMRFMDLSRNPLGRGNFPGYFSLFRVES